MLQLHILLVDDNVDFLRALAKLLKISGFEVHTAQTSRAALATMAEFPIDLVITDLALPDQHGNDLMRLINSRWDIPGIALSGYDEAESKDGGFAMHLRKPIELEKLLAAIRAVHPTVYNGKGRSLSELVN